MSKLHRDTIIICHSVDVMCVEVLSKEGNGGGEGGVFAIPPTLALAIGYYYLDLLLNGDEQTQT